MLAVFLESLVGNEVLDWSPQEFRRIYSLAEYEEITEAITQLNIASEYLLGFARVLERLKHEKPPRTMEALERLEQGE